MKKFQSLRDQQEKPAAIADALWAAFGATTLANMGDACRLLAHLWESAWIQGWRGDDRHAQRRPCRERLAPTVPRPHGSRCVRSYWTRLVRS